MILSKEKIIIGTRGSKLAIIQTEEVISDLKKITNEFIFELKIIKTHADKFSSTPIHKMGKKGVFVKEIDTALLKGEVDIGVHSMKDLPSKLPEGIVLGAVPKRSEYKDVIYSKENKNLENLKGGSIIGTGSFRRKSQVLLFRKDVEVRDIRGNIETRINKVNNGEYDAIIIAKIGVERLNLNINIFELPDNFLPAAGQGALAVETRSNNTELIKLLSKINHKPSFLEILAERAFNNTIGGGCNVPIGVLGKIKEGKLYLSGEILDIFRNKRISAVISGNPDDGKMLGEKLADEIKKRGGRKLLKRIKENRE